MNICIITVGTRGDVQPFVALARELQARGHKASICTSAHFAPFVRSYGIACRPMRADMMALTQSEEGKRMLGGNPLAIMSNMKKLVLPMMKTMLEDMWSASQDADVLLCHPKALGGYDIAEKLGIPMIASHPVPIIAPTGLFTNPILPFSSRLAWLNQLSYRINRYMTASFIGTVNQWREQMLELPKRKTGTDTLQLHGRPVPVLYGCSPSVMPIDPAWQDHVCMSGFWYLEEKQVWEPPLDLAGFIDSENPPIAISYSSMPLKEPG
ncbi:MAG: glycosyltransferase, partial [Paenibacillus sp.]|nr:glycosyltransferase [Paenibacillus sp.]